MVNLDMGRRLRDGFIKYYQGERLEDDEILSLIAFIEPIVNQGWTMDSRFSLFIKELHKVHQDMYTFMNHRIATSRWSAHALKDSPPPLSRTKED